MMTKAQRLSKRLRQTRQIMCCAESCTGGLIAAAMTSLDGASDVFERGYITYSNAAKIELLTVPTYFIEQYGAVSMETAIAMVEGALLMSRAGVSVAVTGIAGPTGGTLEKPVGTVFIATTGKELESVCQKFQFTGSRQEVQMKAAQAALEALLLRFD